ncbi:kinase-like domain-containing protein [Chaetomium fimeti]|uniref:Kinase-like domain-containing protein n=1 Tax=Chaetomium fimeti TaxID=1854472 RepID=A0AAE0LPB1_9PEZI|nr:kinase-like domain-containing protein [Chaetomium fimeti]
MSNSESAPEGKDKQPLSLGEPSAASEPTYMAEYKTIRGKSTVARRLRARYREKLQARGIKPPPSPPPPLEPILDPLGQELLDAGGEIISERYGRWVIKHACGTRVTKFPYGGVRPSEVEALRFVAGHTSIPVPRVYDVGERHFTMDFIPGETVKQAWDRTLSAEDRALVARQLRDYITQLRAVKSPDGSICSFGGREVIDNRWTPVKGGPFADEAAYNEFLVSGLREQAAVREMVRAQLRLRADHEIVLTHGRLDATNIIVQPGVGVVGIVGWEDAGYYPEYFELVVIIGGVRCGYYGELLNIFPQRYDAEFAVEQVITQWSKHRWY